MGIAFADDGAARGSGPVERLLAVVTTLVAAMLGYALAEAVTRAKASDAFMLPPTAAALAFYALTLAIAVGLALAFELGAPPLAARGGHAARNLRALIRRRFRHGRTRAEIARVEVGLTISCCAVLFALALASATTKSILVVLIPLAIVLNLSALSGMSRLVGYSPKWSALIGFTYGLLAGYVLT